MRGRRICCRLRAPGPIGVGPQDNLAARALGLAAPRLAGTVNSREWRAAELPAANGHGNGRSLATIYSALARGGGDLLSAEAIEACGPTEYAAREDVVLGVPGATVAGLHPEHSGRAL